MRSSILVAAVSVALACSAPIAEVATCKPEPEGTGPTVNDPDTPAAFKAYADFACAANNATAPEGYALVSGYQNLAASVDGPRHGVKHANYMGVDNAVESYDPALCADECSNMDGCMSFNICKLPSSSRLPHPDFILILAADFERDPSTVPQHGVCRNPPSLTRIKCTFWSAPLSRKDATNHGQFQTKFHVVVAGSNSYNVVNSTLTPTGD